MELYFQDDYSLGEIAEEFGISRQAVYEHIKRAEQSLEEYENQLQLLSKHQRRNQLIDEMQDILNVIQSEEGRKVLSLIESLRQID